MKLKWDLEDRCNLNCKHCIVGTTAYPQSISLEKAKSVVDKCKNSNIDNIVLSTKEPFMYPNIIELIEYCSLYNIRIAIITNGTLISDNILGQLMQYSETINYIAFSLEGVSSETNDFVRGNGVFEKVINVVRKIDKINAETNKYIKLILQMNLTSLNFKEVSYMVKKFIEFPFVQVAIGKLYIDGNAAYFKELDLDNLKYEKAISTLISTYKEVNNKSYDLTFKDMSVFDAIYFNTIYGTSYKPNIPDCSIFYGGYSLMSDGSFCACSLLLDKNLLDNEMLYMGNVNDSETIFPNKKFNIDKEYFEYKNCQVCAECIFRNECQMCLLIGLSDENKKYQINKCKFYMDQLQKILKEIIENKVTFKFNDKVILVSHEDTLCVYNGVIGNIELWNYTTKSKEIIEVLIKIYKQKKLHYSELLSQSNKKLCSEMMEKLLFANLLYINKGEEKNAR